MWGVTDNGTAVVVIIDNDSAPLAPQSQATQVIYQQQNLATSDVTSMIESTAWNALLVTATRRAPTVVDNIDLSITWYDADGNAILWEEFLQSFSWDKFYHEVPVRGAQFTIENGTDKAVDLTIYGTTRSLYGQSVSPDSQGAIADLFSGRGGSIGVLKVYRGVITIQDLVTNANFPLGGANDVCVFIPSWSDIINVGVHVTGSIATAGLLAVWDLELGSTSAFYDSLAIPVAAANSYVSGSLHIPRHRAVALGGLPPLGGGGVARPMDITLMYQGYDAPGS
jgi:hypothetical protein